MPVLRVEESLDEGALRDGEDLVAMVLEVAEGDEL